VGGNVIILHDGWGPFLIQFKSDPSGLGVVNEALIIVPWDQLSNPCNAVAVLPLEQTLPPPTRTKIIGSVEVSFTASPYILSLQSPGRAQLTIQHWMHRHVATPGNHTVYGGDFNSRREGARLVLSMAPFPLQL